MIATEFIEGQGLGNMLWCHAVTRAIASRTHQEFGTFHPEKFKGQHFLEIDTGITILEDDLRKLMIYNEKKIINHHEKDVSPADEIMMNLRGGNLISGTMQSLKYFEGISKEEIQSWMKIKNPCFQWDKQICAIHIRGGDYLGTGLTLLPRKYFLDAMELVRNKYYYDPIFIIFTDHEEYAKWLLPGIDVITTPNYGEEDLQKDPYQAEHHIGKNIPTAFKSLASTCCNIISNSSFSWWASYLNPYNPFIVAPAYWAGFGYDEPFWSTNDMRVPEWTYIDKRGNLL